MIPKHKNPTRWQRRQEAIAPYNFCPLPERVASLSPDDLPGHDVYSAGRLTGYLDCELTTASPLYVRGGLTPDQHRKGEKAKDQPAFYYIDDENQPVIPGSSLRGMLRAMVEIVGFGKVSAVSPKPLVYRAVGDTTSHGEFYRNRLMHNDGNHYYTPLMRGGYVIKHGQEWAIRPAKEIGGTTFAVLRIDEELFGTLHRVAGCRNAYQVYVETGPFDYQPVRGGFLHIRQARVIRASATSGKGLRPGTLARSGRMFSKRNEAVVYERDDQAAPLVLTDDQVGAYKGRISAELKKFLGDDGVLREGQPVFYVLDDHGQVFFFGHSRMFRLPYPRSPLDYVPEDLRRPETIDLAEALFGYIKGKAVKGGKERAYAGRVFVGDARLAAGQSDIWLTSQRTVKPKILSGPKPTTFQHYLVQTRPDWVEVGRTRDDRPKYEVELSDYAAPTPEETVIRGHKLYWHKGAVTVEDIRETQPTKDKEGKQDTQHTDIRPVKAGVKFKFRVDFENLSLEELGALLWVLEIAGDEKYRLKLGMGKPLGMGAIGVTAELHLTERAARYGPLFDGNGWAEGAMPGEAERKKAIDAFERFVLDSLGEKEAHRLQEVERIRALLALLSWPGPDPTQTRYMEIERPDPKAKRGKRNEYDDRPVLPDPFGIGKIVEQKPEVRHKAEVEPPEPLTKAKPSVAKPKPAPLKEGEVSQTAKDMKAQMDRMSAERAEEEEGKRRKREEKKRGKRG